MLKATAMTTKVSLRVVLQDKYNSEPGAGKDQNDLTLIAGEMVDADLRAELDLLRSELELVKRELRRLARD